MEVASFNNHFPNKIEQSNLMTNTEKNTVRLAYGNDHFIKPYRTPVYKWTRFR